MGIQSRVGFPSAKPVVKPMTNALAAVCKVSYSMVMLSIFMFLSLFLWSYPPGISFYPKNPFRILLRVLYQHVF